MAVFQSKSLLAQSRLPQTVYSWVLNISETGVSATSLGNLRQCLTTLTEKREFLILNGISCVSVCTHCFLSCQRIPQGRAWLQLFYMPTRYPYTPIGYCCAGLLPPGLDFLIMGMAALEHRGSDSFLKLLTGLLDASALRG